MQLAFCSVCLEKHPFDAMLRVASKHGYRALELIAIPGWIHVDLKKIEPGELQSEIAKYNMELIALYPAAWIPGRMRQSGRALPISVEPSTWRERCE